MWAVLFFVASVSANASEYLKPLPSEVITSEILMLEVKPEFHFEMKAPQICDQITNQKPLSANPRKILCQFLKPGNPTLVLSICDNAKTFCKPESFHIKVEGKNKELSVRAATPSTDLKKIQDQLNEKTLPGFEHLFPTAVLSAHDSRPVFVMVSTDWCPPCNEAKEALLSTPAFQAATADWRRVHVDGDNGSESAAWNQYVPFKFYPTFVLLDSSLREIARYNGAFRLEDFKIWGQQARANLNLPIADLEVLVRARKAGDLKQKFLDLIHWADVKKDQNRLMAWALAAENKPVLDLFTENDVPKEMRADWLRFEVATRTDGTPEEKMYRRLKLLEASQATENFVTDLQDLCEENVRVCTPWVEKLKHRGQFWETKKFANAAEKAVALIEDYSSQADVYNLIGDKENAKKTAEICVEAADEMAKNSPLKLSRAASIGESYCLAEVGRTADAEKLYQQLIASYGMEPTFFIRYANFLKKENRLKDARIWAAKALKEAYGYNWMKAVVLKAKIEISMNDKASAIKTIHLALGELDLSSNDPEARDQKLAQTFRDLEANIQQTQ